MQAYETGCKGCTTYRPNDVTGSVLSVSETTDTAPGEAAAQAPARPSRAPRSSTCPNRWTGRRRWRAIPTS